MVKNLTVTKIERQNVLNNPHALEKIQKAMRIEVTTRTVDNYFARFENELNRNWYEVLRGNRLKQFKLQISEHYVHENDFVNIKTLS